MANSPANRPLRMVVLGCLALGISGCVVDPAYEPAGVYGAAGPVYGVDGPYFAGDPFWNGWGGGYYGGFYDRGFGGTRLYRGGGHGGAGASRGFHGASGGGRRGH